MSDNKNFDDEYQYVEESENGPALTEESEAVSEEEGSDLYADKITTALGKPDVRRNAIIVILALFFLIGFIKIFSSSMFKNKESSEPSPSVQVKPEPQQAIQAPSTNQASSQEIDGLVNNQKNIQNTMNGFNQQISQMTSQMNTLAGNIQTLQQQLVDMQTKQAVIISSIEELAKSPRPRQSVVHHQEKSYRERVFVGPRYFIHYYIQAIIPGRAWLINSEGQTLTVRLGSNVPGYGSVQAIDPLQGRVRMSSGKILRFNQDI